MPSSTGSGGRFGGKAVAGTSGQPEAMTASTTKTDMRAIRHSGMMLSVGHFVAASQPCYAIASIPSSIADVARCVIGGSNWRTGVRAGRVRSARRGCHRRWQRCGAAQEARCRPVPAQRPSRTTVTRRCQASRPFYAGRPTKFRNQVQGKRLTGIGVPGTVPQRQHGRPTTNHCARADVTAA